MPLESRPTQALQTAHDIGCEAIQIFVSSPRVWAPPAPNPTATATFVQAFQSQDFTTLVVHAAYLINCASNTAETRAKSQQLLRWTVERGAALGASDVVFHIGSHGGDGLAVGKERIIAALCAIGADLPAGPRLLLENDVGAGNTVGSDFTTIAEILAGAQAVWGERLGVCIDTAHLWGAGYDIGTPEGAHTILAQMDAAFGLAKIRVIHLNDTVTARGGHRDLHARLGEGIIGMAGLRVLLTTPALADATIILETPIKQREGSEDHDWDDERRQLNLVRDLIKNG
jgi:deoxyribonuclease-4